MSVCIYALLMSSPCQHFQHFQYSEEILHRDMYIQLPPEVGWQPHNGPTINEKSVITSHIIRNPRRRDAYKHYLHTHTHTNIKAPNRICQVSRYSNVTTSIQMQPQTHGNIIIQPNRFRLVRFYRKSKRSNFNSLSLYFSHSSRNFNSIMLPSTLRTTVSWNWLHISQHIFGSKWHSVPKFVVYTNSKLLVLIQFSE